MTVITPNSTEIAAGWHLMRMGRALGRIKDGTHGSFERVDSGVPLLSAKNVHDNGLRIEESESMISVEDSNSITLNGFPQRDDLLLTIVGTIGRCTVYELDAPVAFQRSVCFLRPASGFDSQFLKYFIQSSFFQDQLWLRAKTAAQAGVYMGDVVDCSLIAPDSVAQQEQIAEYLDRETSQIDALIAKQEQLVETLTERRQAVITRAVTRGLDPTVELSDPGPSSVAQVPVHWVASSLRYVIKTIDSGVSVNATNVPAPWGEIGVLKTSCVYTGEFNPNENKTVDSMERELVSCPVIMGRLIVSRMNTPSLVGAAGLVRSEAPNLYLPDRLWQVEVNCNTEFLHAWMQTALYRDQVSLLAVGTSSSMQNLSQGSFRSVSIALPPSSEQAAIVSFIRENATKVDMLIRKARQVIEVLKERRQALISAAVTGKIDVRGL